MQPLLLPALPAPEFQTNLIAAHGLGRYLDALALQQLLGRQGWAKSLVLAARMGFQGGVEVRWQGAVRWLTAFARHQPGVAVRTLKAHQPQIGRAHV